MQTRSTRALWCVAIVVLLMLVPLSWVDHGPSLCLIKAVSGHECPGCGMTRALMHAMHGDLAGAWRFNWRWIIVAPLLFLGAVRWIVLPGRSRRHSSVIVR